MSDSETGGFDPRPYLTKVNGNAYLEVKFRLLFLRSEHPKADIVTELIEHHDDMAVFKATVTLPDGGSATGWAREDAKDFRDYLQKSETAALGRALSALGFGTQFATDHDFGSEQGRVVDAPVRTNIGPKPSGEYVRRDTGEIMGGSANAEINETPATDRQIRYLMACAREAGKDKDALDELSLVEFAKTVQQLSRREASALIDKLQSERVTVGG